MAAVMVRQLPEFYRRCRSAGILLCALFLAGCASLQPYAEMPRVSLVSIKPQDMQMLEQRFMLELRIQNPNSVAIPVEGLSYALEINQREFAYGVSQQEVSIPPYGEALLQVEVVSNLLNVMRQLQQLAGTAGGHGLEYRLRGKIGVAGVRRALPFDFSGTLAGQDPEAPATAEGD
ncbi:MAG TPA: LEA type 2 family protein [Gammaproteobacteria bacterium]|nr:LEA type 2 family protein [Gammaproteobacteria bacterium]